MSLELEIKDPRNGDIAYVNGEHELRVKATSVSLEHFVNKAKGEAFHLVFEQTPTGASDYFFHLENNEDRDLIIEGITFRVASAESFEIYSNVTGTISGGTTVAPVPKNIGSSKTIDGTIESGNNITGISGGTLVDRIYMTSTESKYYNFEQDLIIPKGNSISFLAITGAVQISMTIPLFIAPED